MQAKSSTIEREGERQAKLVLADGTIFSGISFGAEVNVSGECVFQTGMVGYTESLTDPSYSGQILVLSYPLIGNYGIPNRSVDEYGLLKYFESAKVHIAGLVVGSYSYDYSHWNAETSLGNFLKEHKIPAIHGVDTRALIKKIRRGGSPLAKVVMLEDGKEDVSPYGMVDPNLRNLVAEVSTKEPKVYGSGPMTVLAVDCGIKYNQIRCLLKRGVRVKVVPWDYNLIEEDESSYHGVFLSNGPGDPEMLRDHTVKNLAALIKREEAKDKPKPIFGICIGNQVMGLAVGAKTYKLKFGNRGHNQPCVDQKTGRCHLTMQNHGFAIDSKTLPPSWREYFVNANDQTNEGIYHVSKPFSSVQFHPEAKGGPTDTEYLFDIFVAQMQGITIDTPMAKSGPKPVKPKVSKVLVLGSGGLSIGQAGEFDYSGSQAIKALKEEGIRTVLLNPNIATVQTSNGLADKVYFLPVTPEYVIKVIKWERPDGILLTFGGQTALNCGIELYKQNVFKELGVQVLGTPLDTIIATEDREIFAKELKVIGESIAPSYAARSVQEAVEAASAIGYPVVVRAGFALGGLGSGFADNEEELVELAKMALVQSEQVLVEKSLKGWKEIEYEVVRDGYDNCITVCNMENFDPLGVHTGESIVIAPSQTLTDKEYHMLRRVGINVVRHLGVVGECNIQYALNPESEEYYIIEVNARLSRSSALASKATGYPLAFVAAKLALGIDLPSLRNSVTKVTTACFEPSLDYVVVKMPRWDLQKFERVDTLIGTSMKSVGEVMSIGRTFQEAIQKAMRMVSQHWDGFLSGYAKASKEGLLPSANRITVIAQALHEGYSVEDIYQATKIDRWFLNKLVEISNYEKLLRGLAGEKSSTVDPLPRNILFRAKQLGFSDRGIARCVNSTELVIRNLRTRMGVVPFVKRIDTVAAEFPAENNYLFMTYNASESDEDYGNRNEKAIIVLGSGAYCIGSSVEFDYCAVSCIRTLRRLGKKTIMINYNPETVSTDYDECDKLYFEELSYERVIDIYNYEAVLGIVVAMGGQISNNIAMALRHHDVKVIGTSPEWIEAAENRFKFSRMLDIEGVDQPKWKDCSNFEDTKKFCDDVGYPCLVRPSFVLSGAGMNVVNSPSELESFLKKATVFSDEHHVVISKFITDAKEIDLDGVARDGELLVCAISEHIENAGVHSGDATLVLPAQDLDRETVTKVELAARKIAKQLRVTGPFNIQFIAKNKEIKVIECNLRASRSFPFVSKTYGVDLIDYATKAMLPEIELEPLVLPQISHVGVKVPQFSFTRLKGSDPVLGVEMASTGEVACFGENKYSAYLKALLSSGFKMPKKKNVLLSMGPYKEKLEFLDYVKKLKKLGFNLFATSGTAEFLAENGLNAKCLDWPTAEEDLESETSLEKHFSTAMIDLCIILPSSNRNRRPSSFMSQGYKTRRMAIDFSVPLITNVKCAKLFVESLWVVREDMQVSLVDSRSATRTVILPGLIDVHVHMREPGGDHKEDWDTGTAAALAGGFTIVCAMPNTNPPTIDEESFDLVSGLATRKARCDYGLYFGATNQNALLLPTLAHNAVGLKMYLNHTFSALRLKDISVWMDHFQHWPKHLPIVVHAERETMAAALMYATLCNHPVHVAHVSRLEELQLIRAAKMQGLQVTCEVAPHHLFLSVDDSTTLGEGRAEVRPCLAPSPDREALWENMDIIDCIATDHAPHTIEEKDSSSPPPGFPGLETALCLMLTAVNEGRITLEDLVAKMYTNPKRIFSLPDQPDTYIEVDMDEQWKIPAGYNDEQGPYTKCGWTPFAGKLVKGRVKRVVLRGEIAMLDGKVYAKPGTGKDVCKIRGSTGHGKPVHTFGSSSAVAVRETAPSTVVPIKSAGFIKEAPALEGTSPEVPSFLAHRYASQTQKGKAITSAPKELFTAPSSSPLSPVLSDNIVRPISVSSSVAPVHSLFAGVQQQQQQQQHYPQLVASREKVPVEDFKENFLSGHGKKLHRLNARHIVSVKQFSYEDLRYLFSVAHDMRVMVKCMGCLDLLKGKVLANTFYEPSTRTASSFHAAMVRLGGSVLTITEQASSIAKGESLPDTVRTLESYADIIVLRHPLAGAAQIAANHAHVPIINAGDGIGEHPSQALLDVFTIREERGTVNGLRITLVGDLKNGRTVHSLVHLLSLYSIAELNYVSPPSLKMPRDIFDDMEKKGVPQKEYTDLDDVIERTDVLYVTRIQKERFESEEEYSKVKGSYVITPESLSKAKENLIVLHPLPRIDEISPELDTDPRAAYFRQMENGMYIRMALLAIVLGKV